MSYWEPLEHMDDVEWNDWEVRQHLYAKRRLAELDTVDTKAKVARMLAEVTPGPKFCGMFVTTGGIEGKKADRKVCGNPGVRMLALTGDWCCGEHDPLLVPYWGEACCGREEED